jgi:hypothetical protein
VSESLADVLKVVFGFCEEVDWEGLGDGVLGAFLAITGIFVLSNNLDLELLEEALLG